MARNQMIRQLLQAGQDAHTAIYNAMEQTRKPGQSEEIFMRERHFLAAVAQCSRNTMTELSQMLCITPGAATQLAARLEKKGYLTREKSGQDHRVTLVHLTERGQALYDADKAEARKRMRQAGKFMEAFTDEELSLLIRYEEMKKEIYRDTL